MYLNRGLRVLFYGKDVMFIFNMDYCNNVNFVVDREIERQLEYMGEIRRDKWVVEGKFRRWVTWMGRVVKSVVMINILILYC